MGAAVVFRTTDGGGYQLGNKVMGLMLRSPLAAKLDPLWLLDITGRRSGRRVTTPVGLHEIEGRRVLVAAGAWRQNYADGDHPIRLRQGRQTVEGTGRLVTDVDAVADDYVALMQHYEQERDLAFAARVVGAKLSVDRLPTRDELLEGLAGGHHEIVEMRS